MWGGSARTVQLHAFCGELNALQLYERKAAFVVDVYVHHMLGALWHVQSTRDDQVEEL